MINSNLPFTNISAGRYCLNLNIVFNQLFLVMFSFVMSLQVFRMCVLYLANSTNILSIFGNMLYILFNIWMPLNVNIIVWFYMRNIVTDLTFITNIFFNFISRNLQLLFFLVILSILLLLIKDFIYFMIITTFRWQAWRWRTSLIFLLFENFVSYLFRIRL